MRIRHLATLLACLLFTAPRAQAQLIHYWDFNSGVIDLVGGATPSTNTATTSGGLLHLNTSTPGWVEFSNYLVPTSGSWTVELSYRANPGANGGYLELMSQGSSGSAFYIGSEFDQSQYRLGDQWLATGVPFLQDGNFHTLVYENDAGGISQFFIDGVLAATQNPSPDLQANGSFLRFGRQYLGNAEYINADIDYIRIYDDDLTPSDINGAPEPGSLILLTTGLVGIGLVTTRPRRK